MFYLGKPHCYFDRDGWMALANQRTSTWFGDSHLWRRVSTGAYHSSAWQKTKKNSLSVELLQLLCNFSMCAYNMHASLIIVCCLWWCVLVKCVYMILSVDITFMLLSDSCQSQLHDFWCLIYNCCKIIHSKIKWSEVFGNVWKQH